MQTMTLRSSSHQGATPSAGARQLSETGITAPPTRRLSQLACPSSARGAPRRRRSSAIQEMDALERRGELE